MARPFPTVLGAPAEYAAHPASTPRPDLLQAAGTARLALAAPETLFGPAPVEYKVDGDYLIARIDEFEAAEEASAKAREKAERDVDYYDNKQLTEKEFQELNKRGQPPITLNMIRQKIDYLIGLERTSRTKPRALPRTRQHEEDATSVGDALVYVRDDTNYDQVRSRVWADLLKAGWGGVEVVAEEVPARGADQPSHRIVIRRCPWDRMWWDPFSAEEDYEDANHRGLVRWMDRQDAVREYGEDAGQVYDETIQAAMVGGSFDDRPKLTTWVSNGKRRRVRIVQAYFRNEAGEWQFCEFTKGGVLRAGPSPWVDERGQATHPYVWRSAYVDRDNNRYGVIRDLVDPQDEINRRRSKALFHFTVRQTFGTPEASGTQTVEERRRQLARPDGHVELGPGAVWGQSFGVIPTNDQAAGHTELLTQAMQVFEIMGPNAAMMGIKKGDLSGRSVLAQQHGGQIQQGSLTDTLRELDIGAYRKAWNAIRQNWTEETWIRVTDDERNIRWVGLNQTVHQPMMVPAFDPMQPGSMGQRPVIDEWGDPVTQPVVMNPVSELDVDIIIDEAPDAGTMLDEQFALLLQLKQLDKQDAIPFSAMVQAAPNLRNKADLLKAIQAAEQRPPNPLAQAGAQAEVENRQADTVQKMANAELSRARAGHTEQQAAKTAQDRVIQGVAPFGVNPNGFGQ